MMVYSPKSNPDRGMLSMLPMNYILRTFLISDAPPTVQLTISQGENPLDPQFDACYFEQQISYIDPQHRLLTRFDCGISHKPEGYCIANRVRSALLFKYCLSGNIDYNGHTLSAGDFIVVEPYHCFNSVAKAGGAECLWCAWDGDMATIAAEKLKNFDSETVYHLDMAETLRTIFSAVIYQRSYPMIDLDNYLLGFTKQLLALLPAREDRRAESRSPLIRRAIAIIEQEFRTITVEALASRLFVDPSHLSRTFHRELELPPKQYITQTRLNCAVYYLTSTECPLQEIADMIGYSNYSNFYTAFRQRFGLSPDKYRRQYAERN